MAALCTGSYGLSQNCADDSKQYFFVKLTDSAYRAIEDYERNQNKYSTQAKIQISENGGVISFPTTKENAGQQFTFAIDEIEGSLECIQQRKTQLDVLGTLQYKMRIHANDDVYETTRHRMAVAEETQKKKSTLEIKPNQTDIGRRVKLKNSNNRFSNIPSKRDLMNPTSTGTFQSSTTSPNSLTSNLLTNTIGSTILSVSPSTVATNYQQHNNNVSSYSGTANLGTSSGQATDQNSISVNNTNTSSTGLLSTQNSKNNFSNNSLNNLTNSSTKYLQFYNNNNNANINNRMSSSNGKSNSLPTAASSLSSALSSAAGSGTSGITNSYFNNTNNSSSVRTGTTVNTGNSSINGSGSRKNITSTAPNSKNNSRHNLPDIKKRSIRERLIHMLALKNFKKPEIYARLQNEGIRDKEKNHVSTILKEISILRDNTFNLKHQIWNEVNEDWPFYTEQEIQVLKRRKPQNLTPPLSSDGGSSTSGQSPTSTHNGSPPPAVKRPSIDRGSYYEEPTAKKQRISHFKKEGNDFNSSTNTRLHQDTDVNLMGLSYSVLSTEAARRISPRDVTLVNGQNISQQQLNTNLNHQQNSPAKVSSVNYKNSNSYLGTNTNISGNIRQKSPSSHNHNISNSNINSNSSLHSNNNINNNNNIKSNNNNTTEINISNIKGKAVSGDNQQPELSFPKNELKSCSSAENSDISSSINCGNRDSSSNKWMAFDRNSTVNNDPSVEDSADDTRSNSEDMTGSESNHTFDFSHFKKITTLEQRRKYKTEFGNDYDEYRKLLNEIDSVRTRFNVLAQQLHNARNNDANYRSIKRQIIEEYQRIQNQREHQNVKARFNYLHGKLAHIKKLVNEFDKTLTTSDATLNVDLPLSSELSENTNYRNNSPVTSSAQTYDISGNYDANGSRFDVNCDNSDGSRPGSSNGSIRGTNSNYNGKNNMTTSPPNSIHKTSGTPPPSFLGSTTNYHLPKNENY